MRLLKHFISPGRPEGVRFIAATILCQIAQLVILMMLVAIVDAGKASSVDPVLLLVIALAALVEAFATEHVHRLSVRIGVSLTERFALRYSTLLKGTDTTALAALGPDRVGQALTRDSAILVEQAPVVGTVMRFGIFVVFLVAYLATISPIAALVVSVSLGGLLALQLHSWAHMRRELAGATTAHRSVAGAFEHLLHGNKEVRLEPRRGDDIAQTIRAHLNTAGSRDVAARDIAGRVMFHTVLIVTLVYACVAFILPPFVDEHATVIKSLIVVTSIVRFVQLLAHQLALLPVGEAALANLESLERDLAAVSVAKEAAPAATRPAFKTLSLQNIVYHFQDTPTDTGFTLGPLSLDLQAGSVLFIAGPNGSGKSTLLRALCAVYRIHRGQIVWDGSPVSPEIVATYRRLFAAVFADFHLFDRIYGYLDTDPARVDAILKRVGLAGKVTFAAGRFSNLDLSTGQRKRLALASALIEDKPVLLFDEVAADQDPTFREYFYKTLIPELKSEGKAVVVVTHDERYFTSADQILHMEDGHFVARAVA